MLKCIPVSSAAHHVPDWDRHHQRLQQQSNEPSVPMSASSNCVNEMTFSPNDAETIRMVRLTACLIDDYCRQPETSSPNEKTDSKKFISPVLWVYIARLRL